MKNFINNITKLSIGSANFGINYSFGLKNGKLKQKSIDGILKRAKELGIKKIDTAQSYGDAEKKLGNFNIKKYEVTTKLPYLTNKINKKNYEKIIFSYVNNSLKRLKVKKITTVLLHDVKDLKGKYSNEIFQSLLKLKKKRIIKRVGVSLYSINDLKFVVNKFRIDVVNFPFNVFDQRIKKTGWIKKLNNRKIRLTVRSIFLKGLLQNKLLQNNKSFSLWDKKFKKWRNFLCKENISPIEGCLNFVLNEKSIKEFVVGIDEVNQLNEVVNATKIKKNINYNSLAISNKKLINPSKWNEKKLKKIKNKIVAIVQARLDSTRFPEKIFSKIGNKRAIDLLLSRLKQVKKIDEIIVAIPKNKKNLKLYKFLKSKKYIVYRGDEKNVLKRFYFAAKKHKADTIIRITGDCPFIDPKLVNDVLNKYSKNIFDYVSNNDPPTLPDGMDVEIFSFDSLKKSYLKAINPQDVEHVTPYIKKSKEFNKLNLKYSPDLSHIRLTLDHKADYEVLKKVFDKFTPNIYFNYDQMKKLIKNKKEIFKNNLKIKRNKGFDTSKGIKLWERANEVIPGGNMLFSKKPEIFSPTKWPTYFTKAKKCYVWDMEGIKYKDMSLMGIGTNILGYCNPQIDKAIIKVVNKGNMSTLNCFEEVVLSEKLIEMNPWAGMVKYARTGGEANLIALRIARATTGKNKVAFCGYHGWHDWYLAANLKNNNLKNHLMSGLRTSGVPKKLKNEVVSFNYNDFKRAKKVLNGNNIGALIMEVQRNERPKKNFLQTIRKLTKQKNIILIFDECSSGFRQTFGGLHQFYKIEPDIAVYGKALGNGYPITAVVGKKEIMENAKDTFISSTFWTDRVGPVAALETLKVMEKEKSWEKISRTGKLIKKKWKKLAKKHGLKITVQGLDAMPNFSIQSKNWLKYKSYIIQEMLKKKYLVTNAVYCCIDHKKNILNGYFYELDKIFKTLAKCEDGQDINDLLEGEIVQDGFKRLN